MTNKAMQWHRLPLAMQERPQWLLAAPNDKGELKVPTSASYDGRLYPGSSTDSGTWLSFHYCVELAVELGYGIGYVLAADDPFACVDVDVKNANNEPDPAKWTPPERLKVFMGIVEEFASYTELSQSLQGVHVWCLGKIGPGVKRAGIEIYSQERFIACTGVAVNDRGLEDRTELLNDYAAIMRAAEAAGGGGAVALDSVDAEVSDEEIWERAKAATNGDKFQGLCAGDWQGLGYPSQSEADLSLMSMFTFYSPNDEQCRRMFRQTKLGQRDKANKNDKYLDFTLKRIRARQAKEAAAHDIAKAQAERLVDKLLNDAEARRAAAAAYVASQQGLGAAVAGAGLGAPLPPLPPVQAPAAPAPAESAGVPGLPWPPGLAGAIAGFVYNAAPRPIKEVAIVTALGWLAGTCGRAWVIPGSGLNLYIILVARSGVGKEAMHSGMSALVSRVREGVPSAQHYVDFSEFASGPALSKACAAQTSFVNVAGEFGRKLKRMAGESQHDGPMASLRTAMTNLYQKSGPTAIVGGITYSNKDSNVSTVSGVAYSMIGETTPDTLYASLTESMMEDGFLSRFTIIEYDGLRPGLNGNPNLVPDNTLTERLQALTSAATAINGNAGSGVRGYINRDVNAAAMLDAFDRECDGQINSSNEEAWRQMWNRAHLKAMRIAGLLAVADNHMQPCINAEHAAWALEVIRRDVGLMSKRMQIGDIGQTDGAREKKLLAVLQDYLTKPLPESYGILPGMVKASIVPRKYLQIRVNSVASFTSSRNGTNKALDESLRSLCDSGYIMEMDKMKLATDYGYQGKCYRVVQLPRIS